VGWVCVGMQAIPAVRLLGMLSFWV
jgi:hypothetical protein